MTWLRLDDQLPDHPKVAGLTDGAFRLHLTGLCYSSRHLTDGLVPEPMIHRWGVRHPDRAAAELTSAGLWVEVDGGWEIHDYLEHQRSKAQVEDLSAKRRAAGKKGGRPKADRKQLASGLPSNGKPNPNPETDDRYTYSDSPPVDDDSVVPDRGSSSSVSDPHWAVWQAFGEIVADEWAEPIENRTAFVTSTARAARRERRGQLADLLDVRPDAPPEDLARWIREGLDPLLFVMDGDR